MKQYKGSFFNPKGLEQQQKDSVTPVDNSSNELCKYQKNLLPKVRRRHKFIKVMAVEQFLNTLPVNGWQL